jgi:hypothetical protein
LERRTISVTHDWDTDLSSPGPLVRSSFPDMAYDSVGMEQSAWAAKGIVFGEVSFETHVRRPGVSPFSSNMAASISVGVEQSGWCVGGGDKWEATSNTDRCRVLPSDCLRLRFLASLFGGSKLSEVTAEDELANEGHDAS